MFGSLDDERARAVIRDLIISRCWLTKNIYARGMVSAVLSNKLVLFDRMAGKYSMAHCILNVQKELSLGTSSSCSLAYINRVPRILYLQVTTHSEDRQEDFKYSLPEPGTQASTCRSGGEQGSWGCGKLTLGRVGKDIS